MQMSYIRNSCHSNLSADWEDVIQGTSIDFVLVDGTTLSVAYFLARRNGQFAGGDDFKKPCVIQVC